MSIQSAFPCRYVLKNRSAYVARTLFVVAVALSGCAASSTPVLGGAALGTAAGAGTGALVGAAISRGDIAASAVLGGAIGLPVGLALGYYWQQQSEDAKERAVIEEYIRNQEAILAQQRELELLQDAAMQDIPANQLDFDRRERLYTGPSLGNPTRY